MWKNFLNTLKATAAGVLAGLIALEPLVDDGMTMSEWTKVAIAVLLGWGVVYVVPNRTTSSG